MTVSALTFDSESLADTARLGNAVAAVARPRLVIGLTGHLGAGKTALVRSIAQGLGAPAEAVSSPTYVLVHEYEGTLPIYHFDTYRLEDPAQFSALGVEEYFEGEGVSLVEWADRVPDVLPSDRIEIRVTSFGESKRQFKISATRPKSARVLERIAASLAN